MTIKSTTKSIRRRKFCSVPLPAVNSLFCPTFRWLGSLTSNRATVHKAELIFIPYGKKKKKDKKILKKQKQKKAVAFHQNKIIGKQGSYSFRDTSFAIKCIVWNSSDSIGLFYSWGWIVGWTVPCMHRTVGEHLTQESDCHKCTRRQPVRERCTHLQL